MTFWNEIKTVSFFVKKKKIFFFLTVAMILSAAFEAFSVASFLPLFSLLQGGGGGGEVAGITGVIKIFHGFIDFENKLIGTIVVVFCLFVLSQGFLFTTEVLSAWWKASLLKELQNDIFKKYLNSSFSFIESRKHGSFLFNCITAPNSVSKILIIVPIFLTALFKLISIFIMLSYLDYRLTVILLVMGLLFFSFIRMLTKWKIEGYGRSMLDDNNKQTIIVSETFSGIRQLKIYLLEKLWMNKFQIPVDNFGAVYFKNAVFSAIPKKLVEISGITVITVMIIFLSIYYSKEQQELILPMLGVFSVAMVRLFPAFSQLGLLRIQFVSIFPNIELISNELRLNVEDKDLGHDSFSSFQHAIEFKDVGFSYGNNKKLFNSLNLKIRKNKVTAIVGYSGSGKSTLIDLLVRLYKVNEGSVTVDGKDIYTIKKADWLDNIGFVSQDTFLFNSSVKENIRLGKKEATEEEIISASKLAHAHEFISQLSEGYNTVVGDRGFTLSGGQRQRLAIARALIRDPELIIFDEATSALDNISEGKIKDAIQKISKTKTVLISAHRFSTVKDADYIYVFKDGKIIEEGTHQELSKKNGSYFVLYQEQEKVENS